MKNEMRELWEEYTTIVDKWSLEDSSVARASVEGFWYWLLSGKLL